MRRRAIYAYYIRIYTVYYIIHTARKNLFKINALPKILEKTCLKSMLCLFFGRNAQNGYFDFGHWEILKNQ